MKRYSAVIWQPNVDTTATYLVAGRNESEAIRKAKKKAAADGWASSAYVSLTSLAPTSTEDEGAPR